MSAYKRPYPGEWETEYPEYQLDYKISKPDHYAAYYSGLQWGSQPPPSPTDNHLKDQHKLEENVDFTSDYAAFYSNQQNDYSSSYGNQQSYSSNGGQWRRSQYRGQNRGHSHHTRGGSATKKGSQIIQGTGQFQTQNQDQYQIQSGGQFQDQSQGQLHGHGQSQFQGKSQGQSGDQGRYLGRGAMKRGAGQSRRGIQAARGNRRGRGFPPNQFGGRGRGQGKLTNVPPVHSLAKTKPTFPDISTMSLAEKLHRFCLFLKSDKSIKINAIQTIMNALTSSKLGLKVDFEASEVSGVSLQKVYSGTVKLDGIYLARSAGLSKKELKQSVFEKALNVMLTHTVAEIYHLKDPGVESIKSQIMADKDNIRETIQNTMSDHEPIEKTPQSDLCAALRVFVAKVTNMKTIPDNPVSHVDQALIQMHNMVDYEYTYESSRVGSILYHSGRFMFCGVVMGCGQATNKKVCKKMAYRQVLDRLTTLSINELMNSVPDIPLPEVSIDKIAKKDIRDLPLKDRFKYMMTALSALKISKNIVNPIDVTAMHNGLYPILIYRPALSMVGHIIECDLYIEKVLIATGEASNKKESMVNVYHRAFDLLTTSSADIILEEHRRITDEELRSPEAMDIIYKGTGKSVESNLDGLKRFGHDPNKSTKKLEELVIIEHIDWTMEREKKSFCILQYSCSQNGIYMQWETEAAETQGAFKCVMVIQGKVMGESFGFSKTFARNLAATDALFKLYKTQDVVKVTHRQDFERWVTYEEIKSEAEELKAKDNGAREVELAPTLTDDKNQGQELPNPYMAQVLQKRMEKYLAGDREEESELIFGPGFSEAELRDMRLKAKDLNLKIECRQSQGQSYILVYEKLDWNVLVQMLKRKKGKIHGKYKLLPDNEKPTYSLVEKDIMRECPPPKVSVPKKSVVNVDINVEITEDIDACY